MQELNKQVEPNIKFELVDTLEKMQKLIEIVSDPKLLDALRNSGKLEEWKPDPISLYLLVLIDDVPVGYISFTFINPILALGHIGFNSQIWGLGFGKLALEKLKEILKDPEILYIVTVPKQCNYIEKLLLSIGFKFEHTLSNGTIYQDQIQDLNIYSFNQKRDNEVT